MDQIKLTVTRIDKGGVASTNSIEISTDELKNLGKDRPMWVDILTRTDPSNPKRLLKLTGIEVTTKEVT